ncbi:hypothetical protein BGW80DRAFT_1293104 [Lactifluus volemus]|nr:hypothetical protein BGW80DRAFT_1293104 [Lactifluus volemus]
MDAQSLFQTRRSRVHVRSVSPPPRWRHHQVPPFGCKTVSLSTTLWIAYPYRAAICMRFAILRIRVTATLKVQWTGYLSLVYEIPVSSEFVGTVDLQSLVRRVARAIVLFMGTNAIVIHFVTL